MIIVCPKFRYYSALNDELRATVRIAVKNVVEQWATDKPTIFLEDTFAKSIIGDMCNVVTVTDERDYSQMCAWGYYEDESYMPQFYSMYPKELSPFVKFENPPISMASKNREQYKIKRIAAYEKRLRQQAVKLAEKHKVVLSFIGNANSKSKLEIKPEENDGLLNIVYNLDTGIANCFYSGVWVDIVMAKQILGGLYG